MRAMDVFNVLLAIKEKLISKLCPTMMAMDRFNVLLAIKEKLFGSFIKTRWTDLMYC